MLSGRGANSIPTSSSLSSEYYVRNMSTSHFKASHTYRGDGTQSFIKGYLPRQCIEWRQTLSDALLQYFLTCNYPYRHVYGIPFPDPLRSEIRRFFISLDAYIESPNPVIPEKDILYGSTLKDYAETLKRIRRKSFEQSWFALNFEDPLWWNDVPSYKIKEIGDIFNYSYLIFWKQDDPDDYLYGMEPLNIKKRTLSIFKETLRDILPDRESFQKIEEFEVLKTISSSISYDSKKDKKIPHYLLKPKRLTFSKSISPAKRSVIHVSPNNTRDSVLLDPSDLNTISLIDKQIMEILSRMQGHLHLRNKNIALKRINKLIEDFDRFIQRDIRKEGITKPRELLKAMLEVLHEEYPDIQIFQHTAFYDEFCIIMQDGTRFTPKRGHGLGMANCLTTLMQLTIHQMIIDELINDIPTLNAGCLALNDDFTVGFDDSYHMESYWDKEDEILDDLGIIRAPEKSFYSRNNFVIAERYVNCFGEDPKESYQRRELLLPLACYNIVHAKEYSIAAQSYTDNKLHDVYMDEIRDYWGYEFYPTEFDYPAKVGGWVNDYVGGCDMTMVILDELPYKNYVYGGYNAYKYNFSVRSKGLNFVAPIYSLLGRPKIPEEFQKNFDILSTHEITWKYGRLLSNSIKEFSLYWNRKQEARLSIFKKSGLAPPLEDLRKKLIASFPTVQFYPSDSMISRFEEYKAVQISIDDFYIDPNPHLACISKFNEVIYEFKESFSIRFTDPDEFTKKTSGLLSKEAARSIKSECLSNLLTGHYDEIYYPLNENQINELYLSPISIGRTTALLNWGRGYPIVQEQYKTILANDKKEIFGRFLSLEELIFCSMNNIPRTLIKRILAIRSEYTLISIIEFLNTTLVESKKVIYEPPVEPEPDLTDDFEIGMSDLLEEGVPKLWNWRNNRSYYTFVDDESYYHANRLDNLILQLTFPGLYTDEARLYELQRYENSSHIAGIILARSGIRKLMDPQDIWDDNSGSEVGFGLFD